MATNSSICGICSLRQITQPSKHWCPQCEEALCDECRYHHTLLKVTRSHEPIPMSDYKSIPSFISDIQQSCIYHNEQYQQYCVEHALPICFKCINDHRTCNVTTLEKIINNVKTSEQFLDLESRLGDLLQNIDQIKKDRNSNLTKIEEIKTRFVKEIRQKKAEINNHLDNLEQQVIKDLEEKECQSFESIQKVLSSVTEKETMVTQCQTNFQSIKQYASDLQTFLGIREIEVKVYENEQYLHTLIEEKNLEQLELVWKEDPVLQSIFGSFKTFGSIEVKTQTSIIEFITAKDKQAQLQVMKTKKTIDGVTLILQKEITINGNEVRGCCMSEEGDILFIDYLIADGMLTVFATDNKLKYHMLLEPSSGFDITPIDERTVAITSGNSMEKRVWIL
ncbi:E3 ubiquitin-protein ligase TRIM71-like [Mytilus trossulus]|uniref:E3 ubiquitin-protein ligase TRIM71-like n=1 Tax=Mytilus trossulus TaxID=6551 RepID=UPI003003C135